MKSKKSYINLKKALCSIFGSTLTLTSLSGCARDIIDCVNNLCEETTTDCSFDETTSFVDEISEITTKTSTVGVKDNQISKKVSDSTTTETTTKVNKSDFSSSSSIDDNKTNGNSEVIRDNSGSSNSNNNSISYSNSSENGGSSRGNSGSSNQTPQTQIQVTEPIVIEAPVTQPPVTEPTVTEPPVIETQPPAVYYNIDDICYNTDAFRYYSESLASDITRRDGALRRFLDMSYGSTNAVGESCFILALLNDGKINPDVIYNVFSNYSSGDIENFKYFASNIAYYQSTNFINYINYDQYVCSQNAYVGSMLNAAEQEYYNCGSAWSYISQNYAPIYDENICQNIVLDQYVGVLPLSVLLGQYDGGYYTFQYDENGLNNLSSSISGRSYTIH